MQTRQQPKFQNNENKSFSAGYRPDDGHLHDSTDAALPEPEPERQGARRGPLLAPDAGRKGKADARREPCHSASGHQEVFLVERGAARRCQHGQRDGVPRTRCHGCLVQSRPALSGVRRGLDGIPCAVQPPHVRPEGRGHEDAQPERVDAKREHLPRPALGTWTGNLRRGPLPDQRDGYAGGAWPAGTGDIEVSQALGLRQALRRAQRTGIHAPLGQPDRRAGARLLGDLHACFQDAGAGCEGQGSDVCLPAP